MFVAAVVAVLVIVAGVIVVVNLSGGSRPGAGGEHSGSAASSAALPTPSAGSSSRSGVGVAEQVYFAPGGMTVTAPTYWTLDTSAGIPNVRDYLQPGASSRTGATYFRIGIGNAKAATARFLGSSTSAYPDFALVSITYNDYQGTQAADIEFRDRDTTGQARHVIVRLWIAHDHSLEIELNAPEATYEFYDVTVFRRLVATCRAAG